MPRSIVSSNTLSRAGEAAPYRMPAEWEPHEATWLAWPHYRGDWPGKFEPILWVYAEIVRYLARHERVDLIVNDAASERQVRKLLARANALSTNIRFHRWPSDRVWLRDSGCIFLVAAEPGFARPDSRGRLSLHKNREGRDDSASLSARFARADTTPKKARASQFAEKLDFGWRSASSAAIKRPFSVRASAPESLALNFRFNAWAKYSNYRRDEKIASLMADAARAQKIIPTHRQTRIVLEGGSIDVNGRGTLLTTEECLLSKIQQRNPGMSRNDYEKTFADYLGASNVIWLGKGIAGDDTHGHVDDLARFVSPDTFITMIESNRKDANHAPLRDNLRRLQAARDQDGKPLNVIEIPMPRPVFFEKRRLPASYANFYIANGVVLVPVFNDPNDRIALNTLASLFPTREVVPIYSGDLVWGLGTMHCMTQQQPVLRS